MVLHCGIVSRVKGRPTKIMLPTNHVHDNLCFSSCNSLVDSLLIFFRELDNVTKGKVMDRYFQLWIVTHFSNIEDEVEELRNKL